MTTPVPILTAPGDQLTTLFELASGQAELHVLCLTEAARRARSYPDYLADLATTRDAAADLVALVVSGPRGKVTKLTKRLALLGA